MKRLLGTAAAFLLLGGMAAAQDAPTVAVITPYLAQPGTQFYSRRLQAEAEAQGWEVNVVDTAGDIAAVISRSRTRSRSRWTPSSSTWTPRRSRPGSIGPTPRASRDRHGRRRPRAPRHQRHLQRLRHGGRDRGLCRNRIGGEGRVVMFTFDPFPPVQQRGVVADAIFGNHPDIEVIDRVTPDVQDGGIADSRAKMEAILAANPEPAHSAVWAAWDQPALGALQAIEAAGRGEEGIVITGIDANPQAREAIAAGGSFEASVAQDFEGIGQAAAEAVGRAIAAEEIREPVTYVPTTLVTQANAAE
jgi:ribose transport system substrate-binding protein